LISVAQDRRGADHRIHPPRSDADQNEREQGCESCPLRHDGTGRCKAPMIDDAGNEMRLKRRDVWDELRYGDDYALLALAEAAAVD
jgi:hypothetical protein